MRSKTSPRKLGTTKAKHLKFRDVIQSRRPLVPALLARHCLEYTLHCAAALAWPFAPSHKIALSLTRWVRSHASSVTRTLRAVYRSEKCGSAGNLNCTQLALISGRSMGRRYGPSNQVHSFEELLKSRVGP